MILPLEQQVCSPEAARKLKELGFVQESLFYWECFEGKNKIITLDKMDYDFTPYPKTYSAYTVAELGELLPKSVKKMRELGNKKDEIEEWYIDISSQKGIWNVNYIWYFYEEMDRFGKSDKNEAEVRAKMLIYLKENNLLENK